MATEQGHDGTCMYALCLSGAVNPQVFVWKLCAVTINSLQSEHTTLHYGVPQGSVLGPVLFILYTQPLFNLVSKHAVSHHAFADDNQLYKISTLDEIHQSIETLQNCTTDVKSWMTANKFQLNDNKTEAMITL